MEVSPSLVGQAHLRIMRIAHALQLGIFSNALASRPDREGIRLHFVSLFIPAWSVCAKVLAMQSHASMLPARPCTLLPNCNGKRRLARSWSAPKLPNFADRLWT